MWFQAAAVSVFLPYIQKDALNLSNAFTKNVLLLEQDAGIIFIAYATDKGFN